MAVKRSGVSYADFSGGDLNFVIRGKRGDCEVSAGCEHCYGLTLLERFGNCPEQTTMYPDKLLRLYDAKFEEDDVPFRRGFGSRPLLFPCDLGDLFHPLVTYDFILDAFDVMEYRTDCDWLVLTKRPDRTFLFQTWVYNKSYDPSVGMFEWRWPRNVLFGITVENQEQIDIRFPYFAKIDAWRKWVSMEPLLGWIDFPASMVYPEDEYPQGSMVEWIAAGGESGAKRRPFDPEDALWIQHQCDHAKIRFYFKQGSGFRPGTDRILGGRTWDDLPE